VRRILLLGTLVVVVLGIISAIESLAHLQSQFVGPNVIVTPASTPEVKNAPNPCLNTDDLGNDDETSEGSCDRLPAD
jgi:hypothetical protein